METRGLQCNPLTRQETRQFAKLGSSGSFLSLIQELDRSNLALARNCACPINTKNGGEANDWKSGKPVRVVRSDKLKKHLDSKYVPQEGYRYDGIYKVVKYWYDIDKLALIHNLSILVIFDKEF